MFQRIVFLLVCFIAGKHTQINTRVPNLVEHCLQYRWCFPCCSSMFQVFHCSIFLWGLFQTAVNPYGSWTAFVSISTSFAIASSSSSSGPVLRRLEIQCEGRDWWQPPVCYTSTNLNSTNYTISIALYSWHAGYISWLFGGLIPVNSLSHRFEGFIVVKNCRMLSIISPGAWACDPRFYLSNWCFFCHPSLFPTD